MGLLDFIVYMFPFMLLCIRSSSNRRLIYLRPHTHTQPLMWRLRVKSVILRLLKLSRAPEHVWSLTTAANLFHRSFGSNSVIFLGGSSNFIPQQRLPLCRLRNCCVWILLDSKCITLLPSLFFQIL